MALAFPDSPTVGDTYTVGTIRWEWNGTTWEINHTGEGYGAATGGTPSTITVDGDSYTLLEFTSSGTLTVTDAGLFDVLVVGGGGGATRGAGGAGGYVTTTVYFDANQTVTVGAGGATAARGNHSLVGNIGAGPGGGVPSTLVSTSDMSGASGAGGGGTTVYFKGYGDGFSGNDGGLNIRLSGTTTDLGGGGGGASAAGGDATQSGSNGIAGDGGDGNDASAFRGESATTTYYAGGGGGGGDPGGGLTTAGSGGLGGGGDGAVGTDLPTAGSTNTGGGGGGADGDPPSTGGAGGSGIVLVRFKD